MRFFSLQAGETPHLQSFHFPGHSKVHECSAFRKMAGYHWMIAKCYQQKAGKSIVLFILPRFILSCKELTVRRFALL